MNTFIEQSEMHNNNASLYTANVPFISPLLALLGSKCL